jgi:hypothetical protein
MCLFRSLVFVLAWMFKDRKRQKTGPREVHRGMELRGLCMAYRESITCIWRGRKTKKTITGSWLRPRRLTNAFKKLLRKVLPSNKPSPLLTTTINQPPLTPRLALRVPTSSSSTSKTIPFLNLLLNSRHDLNPVLLSLMACLASAVAISDSAELNLLDTAVGVCATAARPASAVVLVRCAAHGGFQRGGLAAWSMAEGVEGEW